MLNLINDGMIPFLFVEGSYNQRLDLITDPDIPAGSTIWYFDQTDMKEVRKNLQGWACFSGNFPAASAPAFRAPLRARRGFSLCGAGDSPRWGAAYGIPGGGRSRSMEAKWLKRLGFFSVRGSDTCGRVSGISDTITPGEPPAGP